MRALSFFRRGLPSGTTFLLLFASLKVLLHFTTNTFGGYGMFRDELYYAACSEHLSAGYVDQPPLSIFLLAVNRTLFGDSIFSFRFLPALAGGATVFLSGVMARELGGGRFAQALASIAAIVSPIFLAYDTVYSMNAFDLLLWAWSGLLVILILKSGDKKYWLQLGFVLGLGLLNKIDVLWLGLGLFIGMLLTPERRWLRTEYPYNAGIVAFALFFPYIVWNATHGMAHLEFIHNASSGKYSSQTPFTFLAGQILEQNPLALPLWVSGLIWPFISSEGKQYRLLAYIYLTAMVILILNGHSKAEYLSPAYPMLFAAGGVGIERWISGQKLRWLKPVYAVLLSCGLVLAPAAMPILPVETYIRYADALHIAPSTAEGIHLEKLPQFYADMFGWEEKAAAVGRAYHSLSPDDRVKCAVFAGNYGRCGAIDFYSKKYGLPKAIGSHNSYWLWGPGKYTGELVIILGGDLKSKTDRFETVTVVDTVRSEYAIPYENNLPVYVCRNLKTTLKELWPALKHYQ